MKAGLFFFTLYLFLYDLSVLAAACKQCEFKDSLVTIAGVALHLLVMVSVLSANDDSIQTIEFWSQQSWVALAVWFRIIVAYLGEIKSFNWLVGLIRFSCTATGYFIAVFLCGVTAFADSF